MRERPRSGWRGLSTYALPVVLAFLFRWLCFLVMTYLALLSEARAAPSLPDALLPRVPFLPWVDRYNYVLWIGAYAPAALLLLWRDVPRFVRYMVTSGIVAVVRGLCILATGLGPVRGADVNAGMTAEGRWHALWEIANPFAVLMRHTPNVYLTKDLFFSGHTSTTLLLLLYVWKDAQLRWLMMAGHVLVVLSVFFAHLHYTIDVIGAYAIAFSIYALREWDVRRLLQQ